MVDIEANLSKVSAKISEAAARVGRDPAGIRMVAITKTHPPELVRAAYNVGLRDFGENRVYEGLEKQSKLQDLTDVAWHMVGHIQSRKAREVPANFDYVHSVDRTKIARHLNKQASEHGVGLKVFLECNVSGEESKYGWELSDRGTWKYALQDFGSILAMEHLDLRGLMTMAPWVADEEVLRNTFQRLRSLRDFIEDEMEVSLPELSMGMTDDYPIAIEEGATVLRIGRAIFGPRQV